MSEAPNLRKKAWERAKERGLATRIATVAGVRPQTSRRWLLPPGHPDRREIRDATTKALLARRFDLDPNDFIWLHGERAARRRARQLELQEAA